MRMGILEIVYYGLKFLSKVILVIDFSLLKKKKQEECIDEKTWSRHEQHACSFPTKLYLN